MKRLALTLIAVVAMAVASDVAFARGGGGGFGGGGRAGGGGHLGGGGHTGGGHAGGHVGTWNGGSYANRWHGNAGYGWYGGGLGIYRWNMVYWNAWPYSNGTYPGYSAYPAYTWDAAAVYVEPQQQAAPALRSDATTVYVEPQQQAVPAPDHYWYYCASPLGYYPYVQDCNGDWMAVVPQR